MEAAAQVSSENVSDRSWKGAEHSPTCSGRGGNRIRRALQSRCWGRRSGFRADAGFGNDGKMMTRATTAAATAGSFGEGTGRSLEALLCHPATAAATLFAATAARHLITAINCGSRRCR